MAKSCKSIDLRDYEGAVHTLVTEVSNSVSWIDADDLFQEGMFALWETLPSYDPSCGTSVFQFSVRRIKGAMYDHIGQHHSITRFLLTCQRELDRLHAWHTALFSKPPTYTQRLSFLRTTARRYERVRLRLHTSRYELLSNYYIGEDKNEAWTPCVNLWGATSLDPALFIERRDLSEKLALAITQLPEREQVIVALVLYSGLPLRAIGELFGLTEGRISQIVKAQVPRLAKILNVW